MCGGEGGVQRRQLRGTPSPTFHWIWILLIGPIMFHQQSMFFSQRKVFQNGYKREPRTNFNTENMWHVILSNFGFFTSTSPTQGSHHFHWGPKNKTKLSSSELPKTHIWTKNFPYLMSIFFVPRYGGNGDVMDQSYHQRHILFTNFWYVMTYFSLPAHGVIGDQNKN